MTRRRDRITSKAALLDALLLERYGSLHPEYRPTDIDREAAAGRHDRDRAVTGWQPAALRLITDNAAPTHEKEINGLDQAATDPTGTEQ